MRKNKNDDDEIQDNEYNMDYQIDIWLRDKYKVEMEQLGKIFEDGQDVYIAHPTLGMVQIDFTESMSFILQMRESKRVHYEYHNNNIINAK